jgi:hypothetical protein
MARSAQVVAADLPHYVTQRGNRRQKPDSKPEKSAA